MLVTVTVPEAFPTAAGLNVTVTGAVWPADKVSPEDPPFAVNPAPEMLTLEIVTFPVPVFVSVTVCVPLLETFTLPKLIADGLAPRSKVAVGFTVSIAVPLVALPAELVTTTVNRALLYEAVVAGG